MQKPNAKLNLLKAILIGFMTALAEAATYSFYLFAFILRLMTLAIFSFIALMVIDAIVFMAQRRKAIKEGTYEPVIKRKKK